MWTQPEDGETKPGSKWHALKALLLGTVLGAVMMATYEPGSDTIPALQAGDTVEATEKDWASDRLEPWHLASSRVSFHPNDSGSSSFSENIDKAGSEIQSATFVSYMKRQWTGSCKHIQNVSVYGGGLLFTIDYANF